jgi:uncharacterized protein with von Willebrand factor type A (vWA) domain
VPASVTEYLTLLEALEARVASFSVDDFYFLARATLVKDEKHFDRFDRAFAQHFKGIEHAFEDAAESAAGRLAEAAHRATFHRGRTRANRGAWAGTSS